MTKKFTKFAWRHQDITWTNVMVSWKVLSGIQLRAVSQELHISIILCSEYTLLKSLPHKSGPNEANEITAVLSYILLKQTREFWGRKDD